MKSTSVIMILVTLGFIWGGLLYFLKIAFKKEKESKFEKN